jgi:hypothetical protein
MGNLTSGIIVGLLAAISAASVALGKPALSVFLSDPTTATTVTSVVTGILSLAAGFLKGWSAKK